MKHFLIALILSLSIESPALAVVDPRSSPNNKVGIGILSPEADIEEARDMVNNNGQWGWVLLVIKRSEMNVERWQSIFHQLSGNKLIPIVRIATDLEGGVWLRPGENDANLWAEFLSGLYWPTKNRYVQIYNEVNRGSEWGGFVDPEGYARELENVAAKLKSKSDDFFILNAPLDLALADSRDSMDAARFLALMEEAVPGTFTKLDGWASHSYPNPAFSASPFKSGRLGIDGYRWELWQIEPYLEERDLPVFITETGWDRSVLAEEQVAQNYVSAFGEIWTDPKVVAVTPFIFNWPDGLFHSFSFRTNGQTLGKKYYAHYDEIRNLPKVSGEPVREDMAIDAKLKIADFVLTGQTTFGQVSFVNGGNLIWQSNELNIRSNTPEVEITDISWNREEIFPGQEAVVTFGIKAQMEGNLDLKIIVEDGDHFLFEQKKLIVSETFSARILRLVKELF